MNGIGLLTFMPYHQHFMQTVRHQKTELSQHCDEQEGISVIMVSYWTGPVLSAAIESVLAPNQDGAAELIVVDNGNPPAVSGELARRAEEEARLTLVSGHGNVGFARGCNIGVRRARGRYLLLLNPDCCLSPGAIPALLAEAKTLGADWMLGCRVLNPDGSDQRGSRRALLTPYTALVETFRLDRLAPRLLRRYRLNHHDKPLPADTTCIPVVSGACMMLPTATFHGVGGMDEGYFLHVDDLDLCFRLHRDRDPGLFHAACGSSPLRRQQPEQPGAGGVAQDARFSALLSRALPQPALVAPARTSGRRYPDPIRSKGNAITAASGVEWTTRNA